MPASPPGRPIPRWLFQALSFAILGAAVALGAWWAVRDAGLWGVLSKAFADRSGTYEVMPVLGGVVIALGLPALGLILLLRRFSRMPSLRDQLRADPLLGALVSRPADAAAAGGPQAVADPTLETVGRRVAAFAIDRGITVVAAAAGAGVLVAATQAPLPGAASVGLGVAGGAILLAAVLYAWLRDAVGGRSVGRRLLGMRVVDAATDAPIGAGRSFLRELCLHVAPLALVELLFLATRPDRRRLGDRWAGTVVRRDPGR